MVAEVLLAILLFLLAVLLLGMPRLSVPRRPSLEGIDDADVASAYDRISRMPQFRYLRHMFVAELKRHAPSGTLVDVGCGPGYLIQVIAGAFPGLDIMGVDISDEMVKLGAENMSRMGLSPQVAFRKGEAQGLPFGDNSVDFIVSTLSLHHWTDPMAAMDEFRRVLKPGGQFLVFDLRRDSRKLFYWLVLFAQNVALRLMSLGAISRINEPTGSLLSSYTLKEAAEMLNGVKLSERDAKGGLGWLFLWGRK